MGHLLSARVGARLGMTVGTLAVGCGLGIVAAGPAFADLLPLPSPSTLLAPVSGVTAVLAPSPSPSPSPSPTSALSPVFQQLPSPIASPVQQVTGTVSQAAPAAPAPAAAPAPKAVTKPTAVHPDSVGAPQQVAAPRSAGAPAAFPQLPAGSFAGTAAAPMPLGVAPAQVAPMFPVANFAAPLTAAPQSATASGSSSSVPVPAGLPLLIVAVAGVTVAGAGAAQLAVVRSRRAGARA